MSRVVVKIPRARATTVAGVAAGFAEAGVVTWIAWELTRGYILGGAWGFIILVIFVLAYTGWCLGAWWKVRGNAASRERVSVQYLTGLALLLSLALCARLTAELELVPGPGWASKEMREAAFEQGVPVEAREQFFKDEVRRTESVRNAAVVVSVLLYLLYRRSGGSGVRAGGSGGVA